MDPLSTRLALGAAGAAGGAAAGLGVEDVFSIYLYDGNNTARSITNGIDLSGEGGLTWIKARNYSDLHYLYDTERGATKSLASDFTYAEQNRTTTLTSFNSDGFSLGTDNDTNSSSREFASWTFRKAPGFFDVVTWSGNGSTQTISHNLGSVPGCIMVKAINASRDWAVYHTSLGNSKKLYLNLTNAEASFAGWNYTTPTASEFYVGADSDVNNAAYTYVAYLFAHDEAIFGENADQSVIKCGSFTTDGSGVATVNLGWEPQWLLYKVPDGSGGQWFIIDTMRGFASGNDRNLQAQSSGAESVSSHADPTSTGFTTNLNANTNYIYIAIRRGPMKTPTDATTVFDVINRYGSSSTIEIEPDITADWAITLRRQGNAMYSLDRLRGDKDFYIESTNNESSSANEAKLVGNSTNSAYKLYNDTDVNNSFYEYINWFFKRAPGFFDMVTYTGTGSDLTVNHNLGVAPELIIARNRTTGTGRWYVYPGPLPSSAQKHFRLNETLAVDSNANLDWAPTSTTFNADTFLSLSTSGTTYIAYLFATCPGVSKVGSYTGTASSINVDCGFSAGARFVLIKRTDSTGDWYIWDTERGITAGNDPYSRIGSAETTTNDYIDPLNAGFTITSSAPAALNASGGNYIFLAIA